MKTLVIGCALGLMIAGGCSTSYSGAGGPVNLGPNVNSETCEGSPDISADGRTLYFDALARPGGPGGWDLWISKAKSPHRGFGRAELLAMPISGPYDESGPCLSDDGLSLYFASNRPGGSGDFDIWVATRKTPGDPWGEPVNLGPVVNSDDYDNHPSISPDGLTLYFDSRRPAAGDSFGFNDIYMTHRDTIGGAWSQPEPLAICTHGYDYSPDVSRDNLTLYYDSPLQGRDLWAVKRASASRAWAEGTPLGSPFNTPMIDTDPCVSAEGSLLYFVSDRPGGHGQFDIWVMKAGSK